MHVMVDGNLLATDLVVALEHPELMVRIPRDEDQPNTTAAAPFRELVAHVGPTAVHA